MNTNQAVETCVVVYPEKYGKFVPVWVSLRNEGDLTGICVTNKG